ncbi:MAG: MFS transporter, partial [Proteobacteria bacterium]|nr:MFS transporter [Pseudomonadota bacterium]
MPQRPRPPCGRRDLPWRALPLQRCGQRRLVEGRLSGIPSGLRGRRFLRERHGGEPTHPLPSHVTSAGGSAHGGGPGAFPCPGRNGPAVDSPRVWGWLALLVAGYVGVYLCRKNLAVAVPLLVGEFGATREEVGRIASAGTLAYAAGKLLLTPWVDRFGGRPGFIASLVAVSCFGALSAASPSLSVLALAYSCNRLGGSPAWAAMVKQAAPWFGPRLLPFALGVLSLSYVFGGAAAVALAGFVAEASGQSWRAIMLAPALPVALLAILAWRFLPRAWEGGQGPAPQASPGSFSLLFRELGRDRAFWVICALSFCLTLVRETFNDWTVDFIKSEAGPGVSLRMASFLSLPFDVCGATGIVVTGALLGRLPAR